MRKLLVLIFCLNLFGVTQQVEAEENKTVDVVLIGGGIMSATLGTYLHELEPTWTINMYERLNGVAEESSNGWNNAGTGHSAFCEMNYTPEKANGTIDISKAIGINESFEISRQFWSYQVKNNVLKDPKSFINNVPHMSFVWGDDNVNYLRKRYAALQHSTLFRGMEYSEDTNQIKQWVLLVMDGRDAAQKVAATRMPLGTDVNFGVITHQLVAALSQSHKFTLNLKHEVRDIKRNADNTWRVTVANLNHDGKATTVNAKFVFIGAGGAALTLLQKSGIPEADGYGGFPVGGQFLVATNPEVANQHLAKVYGLASVGSPPMSVPHLDTRMLDGKRVLLFGPFATSSSKFLKNASIFDLLHSLNTSNIIPMIHVGLDNFDLVKYLVGQLMMNDDDRLATLQEYYPQANKQDWRLWTADQRVQIIKKDANKGGVLQFGTEVVSAEDGSIAALLGASPGASTAAPIMLHLMEKVFKDKVATLQWQSKLKEIIPSYGKKLNGDVEMTNKIRGYTSSVLGLNYIEVEPEAN
ncbi:malate dehydrogenase (quinone) [Serratia symbiotica]|uniref:malate dehydrogenase (quinone) n=1 Tax=Serratia symbiotica TaxID=138074 RepID=UPI001DEAAB8E|nr:malate dehydrogenase (quinone) [Serratia symbiotica]MCX2957398.1 malate dehydrogenase (quinone) [Serratia symbiotica]NIG87213.1 malate dehydrogenase (quinone) [Serratia symbiotica]USS96104.1 malate dehydrogenase (quinone) [Serratia symbiotica]